MKVCRKVLFHPALVALYFMILFASVSELSLSFSPIRYISCRWNRSHYAFLEKICEQIQKQIKQEIFRLENILPLSFKTF